MEIFGRGAACEADPGAGSRRSSDSDDEYANQLEAELLNFGGGSGDQEDVGGCPPFVRKDETLEGAPQTDFHPVSGGEGQSGDQEREANSVWEGPGRSGVEAKPHEVRVVTIFQLHPMESCSALTPVASLLIFRS